MKKLFILLLTVTMSIDKFGSHIFGKNNKLTLPGNGDKVIKLVDISNVKLYYNLVLPFMGDYNPNKGAFELLQDKRLAYNFPLESSTIIKAEFPKRYIHLKINDIEITKPEGLTLNKGDKISFHRNNLSRLQTFYGELLIKCAVEVEK